MTKNAALAFVAALVLACGVVAAEWYVNVGPRHIASTKPVQAVRAATPSPATAPSAGTPAPVTYVPVGQPSPAPTSATVVVSPSAAPLSAGSPRPLRSDVEVLQATTPAAEPIVPVLRLPPDVRPRILSLRLSTPLAYGGQTVSGTVETSSNVASVEAHVAGYVSPMQKVGVGRFQMSYVIPHLPPFLHRTWMVQVIARNTRGDSVSSAVPLTIR